MGMGGAGPPGVGDLLIMGAACLMMAMIVLETSLLKYLQLDKGGG